MSKTRPYFHDRRILLLLSINSLLAVICLVISLLPLAGSGGTVISQYRSNLGLNGYEAGSLVDIASFAAFAVILYVTQLVISIKLYPESKNASLVVLTLTFVVLIFALITCNALLELR